MLSAVCSPGFSLCRSRRRHSSMDEEARVARQRSVAENLGLNLQHAEDRETLHLILATMDESEAAPTQRESPPPSAQPVAERAALATGSAPQRAALQAGSAPQRAAPATGSAPLHADDGTVPPELLQPIQQLASALQRFADRETTMEEDIGEALSSDPQLGAALRRYDLDALKVFLMALRSREAGEQVKRSRQAALDSVRPPVDTIFLPDTTKKVRSKGASTALRGVCC